jgi:hypothetical protein
MRVEYRIFEIFIKILIGRLENGKQSAVCLMIHQCPHKCNCQFEHPRGAVGARGDQEWGLGCLKIKFFGRSGSDQSAQEKTFEFDFEFLIVYLQ